MLDSDLIDQSGPQSSKTGRMIRGQSNVFVEVKQFDSLPGNARQAVKSIQQFKLGRSGSGDDSSPAILLNRLTNGCSDGARAD